MLKSTPSNGGGGGGNAPPIKSLGGGGVAIMDVGVGVGVGMAMAMGMLPVATCGRKAFAGKGKLPNVTFNVDVGSPIAVALGVDAGSVTCCMAACACACACLAAATAAALALTWSCVVCIGDVAMLAFALALAFGDAAPAPGPTVPGSCDAGGGPMLVSAPKFNSPARRSGDEKQAANPSEPVRVRPPVLRLFLPFPGVFLHETKWIVGTGVAAAAGRRGGANACGNSCGGPWMRRVPSGSATRRSTDSTHAGWTPPSAVALQSGGGDGGERARAAAAGEVIRSETDRRKARKAAATARPVRRRSASPRPAMPCECGRIACSGGRRGRGRGRTPARRARPGSWTCARSTHACAR